MAINPVSNNKFLIERSVQNGYFGLSTAEVNRLGLRLLGIAAAGGAVVAVTSAVLGTLPVVVSLLAIPGLAIAVAAMWYSNHLNDYENPQELERYCRDATRMNLDSIAYTHGWNNTFRWGLLTPDLFAHKYREQVRGKSLLQVFDYYEKVSKNLRDTLSPRFNYDVPSPRESRNLWRTETASKTFEEIIQTYPLDKLEGYAVLEIGELNCLKELNRNYNSFKAERDQKAAGIEREYENATAGHRSVYERACADADAEFNNHYAVRELQGFEMRYAREREAVQRSVTQRKVEARARFDRAVAGLAAYDRLPAQTKIFYDQQRAELSLAESQADNEARVRIQETDLRYSNERARLSFEEQQARATRMRKLNDAQRVYEAGTQVQRTEKEGRLQPVERAFRSSVEDLNRRYKAHLRINGIQV